MRLLRRLPLTTRTVRYSNKQKLYQFQPEDLDRFGRKNKINKNGRLTNMQADKQTGGQTDRQTDRQTS